MSMQRLTSITLFSDTKIFAVFTSLKIDFSQSRCFISHAVLLVEKTTGSESQCLALSILFSCWWREGFDIF